MPYSIVRELTRVATPDTEADWLENARGRKYRQVEQMLAGRKKGDAPTDDPDPTLIEHDVRWKLDAPTRALLRETRRLIEDELGHPLDDATFVDVLCRRALDAGRPAVGDDDGCPDADTNAETDHAGATREVRRLSKPSVMMHLTTCRSCKATVQHGAGVRFVLTKEQAELAKCDAVVVDDENGKRATTTIPPSIRRFVLERDGYRCRFPGCRSTRNLDAHHLRHRARGGDHRSGNLATLCRGHHKLDHDGVISVSGDADSVLVFTRNGTEVRGEDIRVLNGQAPIATSMSDRAVTARLPTRDATSRDREVERNTLAKAALQQAGYKAAIAARAVERATEVVAKDAPLEVLLKEAFQHCA